VLTRAELAQWTNVARARAIAAELMIFRGQVAVPLAVRGRLCGLLILGEKVVGEPYGRGELETLFLLSGLVALQVQNLQLQGQMHDTKAYLEQSLGGMHCGLLTMGTDGRLVFCNPYAARALGTEVEQLRGADLRSLPSPLGDYLYTVCQTPGAAVSGVAVTLARTGVKLRVSTAAMTDEQGRGTGSVMLLEDVTAPEADRDLTARKETLQVLSSIVGQLAHHVRTPLTAIRTYAQLMGRSAGDDSLSEFWEQTVGPELERLEHLIDDQLKLLQQPEPQFQLVGLEALVRDAAAEACVARPDGPVPEIAVAPHLPEVVADPVATREALVYLLQHLRRVSSGEVRADVAARNATGGAQVEARLSCITPGSLVQSSKVLDPLHALQQPEGDLGPAISRQIIEKQGGTVEAVTEDGHLDFRVSFPVLVTRRPETSGVQTNG
jgi:nitrogen-specific signal transduction histidine kinase